MTMQTMLDTSRPFSRCFSGGGDVAPIDKPVGYYQHGLYFGHDNKLLVDHPYNAEKLAMLKKLGLNPDAEPEPPLEEAKDGRLPVLNPEIIAELEARSDADLAQAGTTLVTLLAERGVTVEAPSERGALIRFIAEHAS